MAESTRHPPSQSIATPADPADPPRLWEVDALRGFAVILMICYHLVWDLQYVGLVPVNVYASGWQLFARTIGTLFIFVLGVSVALRAARQSPAPGEPPGRTFWQGSLIRGGIIFGLGMVITLATLLVIGEAYVRFGILHLLGLTLILATPFVYVRPWISMLVGLLMFAGGIYLTGQLVTFPWLLWLGLQPIGVPMVDYYPLLPWAGIALLGVGVGKLGYNGGMRRFTLPDLSMLPPIRGMRLLGRHSLLIYVLHQPLLLGIVTALNALRA
jgi:uncharacterized membrane protein